MRVIAGQAKGFSLVAPKSNRTRPVLDQVKEAIFNILFDVSDHVVLDLFAGSGAVGIEALSRGAASCTFVEDWDEALRCIHKNLEHCRLAERSAIMPMPVMRALRNLERRPAKFDLIFVDPPYEKDLVNKTLAEIARAQLLTDKGLIIVEHHPKEPVQAPSGFALNDQRKYGQTLVSFLGYAPQDADHVS